MKANVVNVFEMVSYYKLKLLCVIFQVMENSCKISLMKFSKYYVKKWVLSWGFHGSFHMLISVQYQVSLFSQTIWEIDKSHLARWPRIPTSHFHGATPP